LRHDKENVMEREMSIADLVELGTASVETQGPIGTVEDVVLLQEVAGLSDD
jgi:hypothetical protein